MADTWRPRRVAVVGAGSLGACLGGLLGEGGLDITLIDVWEEHIEKIRANGLRITGYGGDRTVKVAATTRPEEAGKMDVVIIQTKMRHMVEGARRALPLLTDRSVVVSFSNGLGKEEMIAEAVGSERTIGGTTAQGANIVEPGVVRHAGDLPSTIGELSGEMSDRIRTIAETFTKAGLRTFASDNIRLAIWKKLMANVGINPMSALGNFRVGELFDVPEVKEVIFKALEEAEKVANAEGLPLRAQETVEVLLQITGKGGTGSNRSGMLLDVLAQRKTEIDFINGAIVRLGKKHDIPTPVNQTLVAAVKGLERNFS
jgi:2-dehydropantoate 2-reductase